MSSMREGPGPCEFRKCIDDMDFILCNKSKIPCKIVSILCNHKCSNYREKYDDYDWKDHWC